MTSDPPAGWRYEGKEDLDDALLIISKQLSELHQTAKEIQYQLVQMRKENKRR